MKRYAARCPCKLCLAGLKYIPQRAKALGLKNVERIRARNNNWNKMYRVL
jgi:hypothetical protein